MESHHGEEGIMSVVVFLAPLGVSFQKKKVLRHKINLSLSRALGLDPYDSAESKPNLVRICPQEIANEARVRHVSGASDAFDLHCVTQKVK